MPHTLTESLTANGSSAEAASRRNFWGLTLACIGVVYGDIEPGMPTWQDRLFIFLAQNSDDASSYFQLPTDRAVDIGTQVTV
jgi:K+ transporter